MDKEARLDAHDKLSVDEFRDKGGLHYKDGMKATSKTPGLKASKQIAANSAARRSSIGDMKPELSKMSLNFGGGGSRSNLSSIVHMEEVSMGYMSIDKQEYRLQKYKARIGTTSRSIPILKEEPAQESKKPSDVTKTKDSGSDLNSLQKQLLKLNENPYKDDENAGVPAKKHKEEPRTPVLVKEGELMRKSA